MPDLNLLLQNANWPATLPAVISHAILRHQPEDFRVWEIPLTLPDGNGEHLWVRLRQKDWNTASAAKILARWSDAPPRDVSYAGRKDRNAVTEQWFSIHLPGKPDPDKAWEWPEGLELLEQQRHSRKLKTGALKGNSFCLRLREVKADADAVAVRLKLLSGRGFPNYFGPQRFGNDGDNALAAMQFLQGEKQVKNRNLRATYLSAARSWIFNELLAQRISLGNWDQAIAGDLVQLRGSNSIFLAESIDSTLQQRLASGDISATGPLAGGKMDTQPTAEAGEVEAALLQRYQMLSEGLVKHRLAAARRALRVIPENLAWSWLDPKTLELKFDLPPGSYATSLVKELM